MMDRQLKKNVQISVQNIFVFQICGKYIVLFQMKL